MLEYSRSNSKTQSFELLLLYSFKTNFVGFIHLNQPVGRNLGLT